MNACLPWLQKRKTLETKPPFNMEYKLQGDIMICVFLLSGWYMTGRQESQRDMASVNTKTRRRPSVPCGTWTGGSSVVGLWGLTTQPVKKTRKSWKVRLHIVWAIFKNEYVDLRFNSKSFTWSHCRFGNWSPNYRVSLWRHHPATGSPGVHQQSCGQSAPRTDVWTYETDEGMLPCFFPPKVFQLFLVWGWFF